METEILDLEPRLKFELPMPCPVITASDISIVMMTGSPSTSLALKQVSDTNLEPELALQTSWDNDFSSGTGSPNIDDSPNIDTPFACK